ncbi:hypothetical protein BOX15_Mlig029249g1 [Macrostomum lignano]|uniref:PARP catalytic domain-containing protein n=1 Tax=Macrostomum lignano TaxID=282301 RepID=A0A267F1P0_9PLAT|nr:hypothetical protein BOX15_Mlig029249g1 [Macrostomum lignano]
MKQLKKWRKSLTAKSVKTTDTTRSTCSTSSTCTARTSKPYFSAVNRKPLLKDEPETATEYATVSELVTLYLYARPLNPLKSILIKSIERIEQPVLDARFHAARELLLVDSEPRLLIHDASLNNREKVFNEGFTATEGPYGWGIYFSTENNSKRPSYSTQSGVQTLLVGEVLLGKEKLCDQPDPGLNLSKIQDEGCDSVLANNSLAGFGTCVVYRHEQATPRYLVTFEVTNNDFGRLSDHFYAAVRFLLMAVLSVPFAVFVALKLENVRERILDIFKSELCWLIFIFVLACAAAIGLIFIFLLDWLLSIGWIIQPFLVIVCLVTIPAFWRGIGQ